MKTIEEMLRQAPASAAELIAALGISQPTLSRKINDAPHVLKMGKGRATGYALSREIGGERRFPLYRINQHGQVNQIATLFPIWPGDACAVEDSAGGWHLHDGLPWYLSDMRPQGFLGRVWGREMAARLDLPEDIRLWTEKHTLLALSQWGEATVGDLLLGEASYQRFLDEQDDFRISAGNRLHGYLKLAELSLAGEQVGSSVGGEQPKFSCIKALNDDDAEESQHVLVKFSLGATNENAARWADLLQTEAIALATLRAENIAASLAEIILGPHGEVFLELQRFDRLGVHGRRSLISLEAVAAEFLGSRAVNWIEAGKGLLIEGVITQAVFEQICQLYAFGKLITNSDMHAGNLSFIDDRQGYVQQNSTVQLIDPKSRPLALSPVYDMLPMAFSPTSSGNMRQSIAPLELDGRVSRIYWQRAQKWALDFWQQVAECSTISAEFRQLALQMREQVAGLTASISRLA